MENRVVSGTDVVLLFVSFALDMSRANEFSSASSMYFAMPSVRGLAASFILRLKYIRALGAGENRSNIFQYMRHDCLFNLFTSYLQLHLPYTQGKSYPFTCNTTVLPSIAVRAYLPPFPPPPLCPSSLCSSFRSRNKGLLKERAVEL